MQPSKNVIDLKNNFDLSQIIIKSDPFYSSKYNIPPFKCNVNACPFQYNAYPLYIKKTEFSYLSKIDFEFPSEIIHKPDPFYSSKINNDAFKIKADKLDKKEDQARAALQKIIDEAKKAADCTLIILGYGSEGCTLNAFPGDLMNLIISTRAQL